MPSPQIGVGTFRLKEQAVFDSVRTALEVSYHAIDIALIYDNEAAVGWEDMQKTLNKDRGETLINLEDLTLVYD